MVLELLVVVEVEDVLVDDDVFVLLDVVVVELSGDRVLNIFQKTDTVNMNRKHSI